LACQGGIGGLIREKISNASLPPHKGRKEDDERK